MRFTEEQQFIIDNRDSELLVSAAAGSGKTAVLVTRIIERLLDQEDETTLDNLLVVTFTKAAAAEMKERVSIALEQALSANEQNHYVADQMVKLSSAKITTIHSFCLSVIREHFDIVDIDPAFRVADESEVILMRKDIMAKVLESAYEAGSDAFYSLVESYAGGKTDTYLENLMISVWQFAGSMPRPHIWLQEQLLHNDDDGPILQGLKEIVVGITEHVARQLDKIEKYLSLDEGLSFYQPIYEEYRSFCYHVLMEDEPKAVLRAYQSFEKLKLPAKRKGFDLELKVKAKAAFDVIHKVVTDKRSQFLNLSLEDKGSIEPLKGLYEIISLFDQEYSTIKKKRRVIDFSDIEHMALDLLAEYNEETGSFQATDIAKAYNFSEVMIDEYQDSNLLQEVILRSVSGEIKGKPNMFLVGDVKQSIYKFRMAKPELFMEKYDRYSSEGQYIKSHMTQNFRSNQPVIDSVNTVFEVLMTKSFGGITYDQFARLNKGFPYEHETVDKKTEMLMIDRSAYNNESRDTLEAIAIATRIDQLISSGMLIYDKTRDGYRPVNYKDIVVLHRSPKSVAESFKNVFRTAAIPLYMDQSTGYLKAMEVSTLVNLLKLIDNPEQDVALAAVLKSPLVQLSSESLATIRLASPEGTFYHAMMVYIKSDLYQEDLYEALTAFINRLDKWRIRSRFLRIDQLLSEIMDESNYLLYMLSLPSGSKRVKNVELLISRAVSYENTGYQGIYQFLRYIDYIEKYDIELGEATMVSAHDQVVSLMSIHKSKGLEYPVVFIAGMDKQFNKQDLNKQVVMHQDFGLGCDLVDIDKRYRRTSLKKEVIKYKLLQEALEEETRILYVAMTRAREKLIMVGATKDIEKSVLKWENQDLSSYSKLEAMSYQDWLMPMCLRLNESIELKMPYELSLIEASDNLLDSEELIDHSPIDIEGLFSWNYQHTVATQVKASMSVTELKLIGRHLPKEEISLEKVVPGFIDTDTEAYSGADIGTLYHRILYLMPVDIGPDEESVKAFLYEMVTKEQLKQVEIDLIEIDKMVTLLKHDLWQQILEADYVKREMPFVMGVDGSKIDPLSDEDMIMIQGIIDLFYVSGNNAVIVDYKSDKVPSGGSHMLLKRYGSQLDLYKQALEDVMGYKVVGCYIYALSTGDLIPYFE